MVRSILGPPVAQSCDQSATMLNCIITWHMWGISWEADPRHAEIVYTSLGVSGHKVSAPVVREKIGDDQGACPLGPEDAAIYRSMAMRIAYLAMDRPDLQQCVRDLARALKDRLPRA